MDVKKPRECETSTGSKVISYFVRLERSSSSDMRLMQSGKGSNSSSIFRSVPVSMSGACFKIADAILLMFMVYLKKMFLRIRSADILTIVDSFLATVKRSDGV